MSPVHSFGRNDVSDTKPKMCLQEVKDRVKALADIVAACEGDSESWHADEDDIVADVLHAIADGRCLDAPPEDFAAETVKVYDLDYCRRYA